MTDVLLFGTFLVAHLLQHGEPLVAVVELRAQPLLPHLDLYPGGLSQEAPGEGDPVRRRRGRGYGRGLIFLVHFAKPGSEVFRRGQHAYGSDLRQLGISGQNSIIGRG